jgi:hypothetical protein
MWTIHGQADVLRAEPLLTKDKNKKCEFNFPGWVIDRELQRYVLLQKLQSQYSGEIYGAVKSRSLNAVLHIWEVTDSSHDPEILNFS